MGSHVSIGSGAGDGGRSRSGSYVRAIDTLTGMETDMKEPAVYMGMGEALTLNPHEHDDNSNSGTGTFNTNTLGTNGNANGDTVGTNGTNGSQHNMNSVDSKLSRSASKERWPANRAVDTRSPRHKKFFEFSPSGSPRSSAARSPKDGLSPNASVHSGSSLNMSLRISSGVSAQGRGGLNQLQWALLPKELQPQTQTDVVGSRSNSKEVKEKNSSRR